MTQEKNTKIILPHLIELCILTYKSNKLKFIFLLIYHANKIYLYFFLNLKIYSIDINFFYSI